MSITEAETGNYVDLKSLKTQKIFDKTGISFVLEDDVVENDILLVKSGGYLTEELINRLLNFGVKQVKVNISEDNVLETPQKYNLKEFINTQNVLLVENNLLNASWLVRNLMDFGFKSGNIFVTDDPSTINGYFRIKKMNFIFIEAELYERCPKCVNKYSLLRNTHVFITIDRRESARKLVTDSIAEIKFLSRPFSEENFRLVMSECISHNFNDYYFEEVRIS